MSVCEYFQVCLSVYVCLRCNRGLCVLCLCVCVFVCEFVCLKVASLLLNFANNQNWFVSISLPPSTLTLTVSLSLRPSFLLKVGSLLIHMYIYIHKVIPWYLKNKKLIKLFLLNAKWFLQI